MSSKSNLPINYALYINYELNKEINFNGDKV